MTSTIDSSSIVFQFKIGLKHLKPPIWRRVLVPGDYTFKDLHFVIQSVMGWSGLHLHKFRVKDPKTCKEVEICKFTDYLGFGQRALPESIKLVDYFRSPNTIATYEYDFGFSWDHVILLEKILPVSPGKEYPQCVAGKRATPPEEDPGSDADSNFDPETFDHKLIVFRKCRNFLQKPQGDASTSGENVTVLSPMQNISPQVATFPKRSAFQIRGGLVEYFAALNSKLSSTHKRSLPQHESNFSKKPCICNVKDLMKHRLVVPDLSKTKHIDQTEPNSSNCDEPIENSTNKDEDIEDSYGKYIASQIREIKDLEAREDLRIEIQQAIKKYRFKKI